MDKALPSGGKDCEFESCQDRFCIFLHSLHPVSPSPNLNILIIYPRTPSWILSTAYKLTAFDHARTDNHTKGNDQGE